MDTKRFIIQDERVVKDTQKYITENGYVFSYASDAKTVCNLLNHLYERILELENVEKTLQKQIHLIHMSSMFSTVRSFKGDVSKRYKYSDETDTVYDTANHYGQYDQILDKKEITMLLNEYETLLKDVEEENEELQKEVENLKQAVIRAAFGG